MFICRLVFPPALLCELASPTTPPHPPPPASVATRTRQLMCGEAALVVSAVYLLPFRGIHLRGCSSNKFHSTASAQWGPTPPTPPIPPPQFPPHLLSHSVTASSLLLLLPSVFLFVCFFLLCTWSFFFSPSVFIPPALACKWTARS